MVDAVRFAPRQASHLSRMPSEMTMLVRIFLLVMLSATVACSPRSETRGNYLTDSLISEIKPGETDRRTLIRLVGPPSTQGTFDSQVWYYIGRQTEQWAFMKPDVTDQRVVAVYFDDKGIVEHVQRYNKDDAREVDVVTRETPTAGHELGFIEQIIGNLGVLGGGGGGGP